MPLHFESIIDSFKKDDWRCKKRYVPMLTQQRVNYFQVMAGWGPCFYSEIWYITNVVIKSFPQCLRQLPDHRHMALKCAYEMVLIINISKFTANQTN